MYKYKLKAKEIVIFLVDSIIVYKVPGYSGSSYIMSIKGLY